MYQQIAEFLKPRQPESCLIVGAGITGLVAARSLRESGVDAVVLERSDRVGGRMGTCRFDGGVFDTGAQWLTARSWRTQCLTDRWLEQGLLREWSRGFVDAEGVMPNDRYPRLRAVRGMQTLADRLADGLDIRLGAQVSAVAWRGDSWEAVLSDGEMTADAAILTPPVPESLALVDAGNYEISDLARPALDAIRYDPCIAVLATLSEPPSLPDPGGIHPGGEPVGWIGDNHRKGISPGAFAVTIHAGPLFSREHLEADDDEVAAMILEASQPWIGSAVRQHRVMRWRCARPIAPSNEPFILAAESPMLLIAGDGFGSGDAGGAALSGILASEFVVAEKKNKILALLGL